MSAPSPASAPPAGPGVVVAGFRLEHAIGRGAHAEVHLATDLASGVKVALKLLRPEGGAEAARRFAAEAATAQRLQHPDIVRVFGAGHEGELAWIAMEPLAGGDLERYTRPSLLLPEAVVLRIAERVALALAHAHGQGVVHRDVKPANVMLDWRAGRVVLTDFGIARAADAERTRTGIVLGTPAYMAPEQLAGGAADAAGDIYALGVMLFQLLAGRLPFDAPSLGELLRQVAREPAPDLAALRPDLPVPLAALVAQVLAKRPAERPAGAAALAGILKAHRLALQAAAGGPMSHPPLL